MMTKRQKGYKGLPMEGFIATWYAKNTRKDIGELQQLAAVVAHQVADGSRVLEIAPGPGYLAIELAKLGTYMIVGLDISASFVRIATENAHQAGVHIEFRQGDAASMPFEAESFDFTVCRAAFKNFAGPLKALHEMHRVLKVGGKALIIDLRPDASSEAIDTYVNSMWLSRLNILITKWIFKHMLLKRAYSQEQFQDMVASTPFKTCGIKENSLGLEVSLRK
jgi:ubiquinone/menaquinone biosynthesis C-methylase UbiE